MQPVTHQRYMKFERQKLVNRYVTADYPFWVQLVQNRSHQNHDAEQKRSLPCPALEWAHELNLKRRKLRLQGAAALRYRRSLPQDRNGGNPC